MTEMTEMTVSTEATDISTESSSPAESSVAIETNAGPVVGGGHAAAVEGLLEGGGPVAAVHEEEDLLESLGVQGEMKNLVDIDDDEGLKPLTGSAIQQMLLPESDRVMQEPVEYIEEDNQAREFVPNFVMPVAERVREEPVVIVIPEARGWWTPRMSPSSRAVTARSRWTSTSRSWPGTPRTRPWAVTARSRWTSTSRSWP